MQLNALAQSGLRPSGGGVRVCVKKMQREIPDRHSEWRLGAKSGLEEGESNWI